MSEKIQFRDLPVIVPHLHFIGIEGLYLLETYQIYRIWNSLSPEEKSQFRPDFQQVLQPRSLVYIYKHQPKTIHPRIRRQYPPSQFDWEDEDYVGALEKMYWVYEPRYWTSYKRFEPSKKEGVRKRASRPLFLGLIDWQNPKTKKSKIEDSIDGWLYYLGISKTDAETLLQNIYDHASAYYNPKTRNFEPKISLWAFFTQDQNPEKFTQGKFRSLGKDEEAVEEGVLTFDPEITLRPPEEAPPLFLGVKKEGNIFNVGDKWKFRGKDKASETFTFQGRIPSIREPAKARLLPLDELFEKNYLLPPLKRPITVLDSADALKAAISDLRSYR